MEIVSLIDILIRFLLGLGIGFAIGMTGIGSGVLVMPSLIYIVGLSEVTAIGTGLLFSMLARVYGVYEHLKLGTVRKRTAFYIILGGAPAVLITSFAIMYLAKTPALFCIESKSQPGLDAGSIPEDIRREFADNNIPLSSNAAVSVEEAGSRWAIVDKKAYDVRKVDEVLEVHPGNRLNLILRIIISIVMLMTWFLMLISFVRSRNKCSEDFYAPLKVFPLRRKLYGIAAGVGIGALIGATSIGGGVLIIPILVTVFWLSPNNTVGTSVLIGITMSAMGSLAYLLGGKVNIVVAMTMFVGSIPGVYMGSRMAVKVSNKTLSIIFFAVITISVIVMFAGLKR